MTRPAAALARLAHIHIDLRRRALCTVLGGVAVFATGAPTAAQLRIVNYNVAQLGGDFEALIEVFAALNVDDPDGYAVAPHVYLFQEVLDGQEDDLLFAANFSAPPGVLYLLGTYTNQGEDFAAGAQAMIYRWGVLDEDEDAHRDITTGGGRRSDRWRLQLVDYGSEDAAFFVYSSHLKAGDQPSDAQDRENGALQIRANADALPDSSHIIYAGDFNLQHHLEDAYMVFRAGGPAAAVDPLGIGTWTGSGQAMKHTQSPRSSGGGLIGGGMDDRFDFQLSTEEFHDGEGLSLMAGTYRALGNDGAHYDRAINFGANTYYPDDIERSNALANALHDGSDHIPVVVEYQFPAPIDAVLPDEFGRVIQDAVFAIDVTVGNGAPAVVATGADFLIFDVAADGALWGSAIGAAFALSEPSAYPVDVDTSVVGIVDGTVTVSSTRQGVGRNPTILASAGTIVCPSSPSFDESGVVTEGELTWDVAPNTGTHAAQIILANVDYDALQALLDVDAVDDPGTPFAYVGGGAAGIGADPATLTFEIDTTGLAAGTYEATVLVHTSDEDLPGEASAALTLDLTAVVSGDGGVPGDVDGDGDVDFTDLVAVLAAWGPCGEPPCPADLDDSGDVGFADLLIVLAGWTA